MAGFGFGFGSRRNLVPRFVDVGPNNPVPLAIPSQQWNGTAGSGFTAVPTDPTRTTAKPVLRLMVAPNQYYTDEILVGVMAAANDGNSLFDNLGLTKVVAHYEGATYDIDSPVQQTFADANGVYRTYYGWWVLLKHDGRNGHANIYFEAIARDTTMQTRVMGPYQFSPQPKQYDALLTVGSSSSGATYPTLQAAVNTIRPNNYQNPEIRIIESGNYDVFSSGGGALYDPEGYINFTTAPGVQATIRKTSYTSDAGCQWRSRLGGMHFIGSGITIDEKYISTIYVENALQRKHWFDGCNITNSAGRGALWRGRPRDGLLTQRTGIFTEAVCTDNHFPFDKCMLVRGCISDGMTGDVYGGCECVIGNEASNHRVDDIHRIENDALTVYHDGTGGQATLDWSGTNSASTRTLTFKVAGASVGSFTVSTNESYYTAGTNYSLQNVVDYVNALGGGWSATLIDTRPIGFTAADGRAARFLSLPGLIGNGFTGKNVGSGGLKLVTLIDAHTDYWLPTANAEDNFVVWGNKATGLVAQNLIATSIYEKRDFLLALNALSNLPGYAGQDYVGSYFSQYSGRFSHCMVLHNTMPTQQIVIKTGTYDDKYNLFANNVLANLVDQNSPNDTIPIHNNHIPTGQILTANGSNVVGMTVGGDASSLFVDYASDMRPTSTLTSNQAVPVLPVDRKGNPFKQTGDSKGAWAGV